MKPKKLLKHLWTAVAGLLSITLIGYGVVGLFLRYSIHPGWMLTSGLTLMAIAYLIGRKK